MESVVGALGPQHCIGERGRQEGRKDLDPEALTNCQPASDSGERRSQRRVAPMGCKRWFGFAAALLGVALMVTACGTVRTGATSGAKPRVHGTVPPPKGVPNTPPPPLPDRWLAYLTAVNPGSAIDFATARVGWRLDGQDGVPHLDKLLAAGPAGTSVTWPGSSVAKTTDGGRDGVPSCI